MRELVLKRQTELEEIYREVHMEVDTDAARKMLINLIDSGSLMLSVVVNKSLIFMLNYSSLLYFFFLIPRS